MPLRLIDGIPIKVASEAHDTATASAILEISFSNDVPELANESNIVHGVDDGDLAYIHGHVRDASTAKLLADATVDIWQASTKGL